MHTTIGTLIGLLIVYFFTVLVGWACLLILGAACSVAAVFKVGTVLFILRGFFLATE